MEHYSDKVDTGWLLKRFCEGAAVKLTAGKINSKGVQLGYNSMTPFTREQFLSECVAFFRQNYWTILAIPPTYPIALLGEDFITSRNYKKKGFLVRDLGLIGSSLHSKASNLAPFVVSINSDEELERV